MKAVKLACQISLITLFVLAGHLLAELFRVNIPGSIIGLLLLFLSLQCRLIRLEWVEGGASFLLAEMLIFFVPAAVGVMQYGDLIAAEGLRITLVIILSTILVMSVSGLLVDYMNKKRRETDL
ncbi:CidA/LrgA family protein [Paenibacillus aurantius]|uniref:CidA/LrgA family protein n=1 Tax=Paenibacillus aurantius TaxID=2918900 RepID=A0AA96RH93_9BACL|nr:CidA/LrgA family protein [Paenibacillus aurantius]WNQ13123.1 CidA/LrgA family protein [Paenibacillus aurantius]